MAAKVLAMTGVDLLLDEDLRKQARSVFEEQTAGKPYQSPVPQDQPVPLPEWSQTESTAASILSKIFPARESARFTIAIRKRRPKT